MTSPLLARPGAVAADPPDDGVVAHYGDPFREERVIVERAGWVDRSNRGVVRITGPDRLTWLHNLTTQQVEHLPAGTGAETLVLSPNGHVEHHLVLADDGETTWIDVEPGTASDLIAFLESMRFLMQVEVSDVSDDYAVVSVLGPQTADVLAAASLQVGSAAYDVAVVDGVVVRRMPWPLPEAADLVVPRSRLTAVADALTDAGAAAAGTWAFEALRVAAGKPRLFLDTDHRTLPHEVGWIETAVHLTKGCYRGQETVARVHNLGRPPRRLVLLHLDGSVERLPARGAGIVYDDATIGFVGTAARHYELGPLALGLVRRNTPVDVELVVDGVAARADVIVDPEAGLHIKPVLR